MNASITLILAAIVLAIGTFAFRFSGPVLSARVELSSSVGRLMTLCAVVLLAALVAVTALLDGQEYAGIARPAGVAVGGVIAWRRAPFVVVVVVAAVTAAGLRLLGIP